MTHLIDTAIKLDAAIYGSISGGKDGQAMVRTLVRNGIPLDGLLHCDLGRSEWPQSMSMCESQASEYVQPLHVLRRADGLDLLAYMQRRLEKLRGTGKPFWPSSAARYCTSDLKRGPSDAFFRTCGTNLIISAEGIRAQESRARAKKSPLTIRPSVTSSFYAGMSAEQALAAYRPDKRLVLNWYPVFNMSIVEVWASYDMTLDHLYESRQLYKHHREIASWWAFHPAYAMGNERVSCMLCILGCLGDLQNGARENTVLLDQMIEMEDAGGATFRDKFSLRELKATCKPAPIMKDLFGK